MGWRVGPGPVFVYEWLTTARRWQPYAVRSGFVLLMLVGMAMAHASVARSGRGGAVSLRDLALFGRNLYGRVAWVELALILLAAPAATAGAICLDRARGTLDHMLVTDLSNAEIVLGKLAARLIPVLGLIAGTVPVLAMASWLGGIDPKALVGLFLVAVGCAVLACSLAMALSVYGRRTHEVVMMAYVLILSWVMAPAILETLHLALWGEFPRPPGVGSLWGDLAGWLNLSNPYYLAIAPYDHPDRVDEMTFLGFLAGCLAASAALLALAMARVRRVAVRQAGRPAGGVRRRRSLARLPGPSLDGNPVAWREWHRTRPSLMMRVVWRLYIAVGLLWVGLAIQASRGAQVNQLLMIGFMNNIQVSIGLLLLSVIAATSLAEERARGSLEVLLSTPIPTRSILAGKWWGSFRRAIGVAIWPAGTAAFLAYETGSWGGYELLIGLVLAYAAAITSLGLAIATWVRRPGRAVVASVMIPVLLAIGWPFLLAFAMMLGASIVVGQALMVGDPLAGVMYATMALAPTGLGRVGPGLVADRVLLSTAGWIVVLALLAAALFRVTAATFDDCLGRIPDGGIRPPADPRRRASLSTAELLELVSSAAEDEEP